MEFSHRTAVVNGTYFQEKSVTIKEFNKILSSSSSNKITCQLLMELIPVCSKEEFIENCVNWMQWCCKVDNNNDNTHLSLEVLNLLILESTKYGEMNKSVSYFLSSRFFRKFFNSFIHFEESWKCIETCFLFYKGPCNAHQENIKQHLIAEIQKNIVVPSIVARVYAYLPCIGESGNNGINYKNKWKNQFENTLNICHSILHDLFADIIELQTYEDVSYEKYSNAELINEEYLYTLFYNYCSVLRFMLLCRYPVAKTIVPEKIFDLICRCLNVNVKNIGKDDSTQVFRILKHLPRFHIVAYSLLNAFMICCKTHLLPYSRLISKLIRQTLQTMDQSSLDDRSVDYLHLRISAYDTMRNWLTVGHNSAYVESFCKIFLTAVLDDMPIKEHSITLKEFNVKIKYELQSYGRQNYTLMNEELSYAALKVLQNYLMEYRCFLKPDQHKTLQESIIKQILNVQNLLLTGELRGPFSSSKCRYELYHLFMVLVNYPCPLWPSPIQWALRLLTKGINDYDLEISSFCSTTLANLLNIIHSPFRVSRHLCLGVNERK